MLQSRQKIEDNSRLKDDIKDSKFIVNLVKDGNFGMLYPPRKNSTRTLDGY